MIGTIVSKAHRSDVSLPFRVGLKQQYQDEENYSLAVDLANFDKTIVSLCRFIVSVRHSLSAFPSLFQAWAKVTPFLRTQIEARYSSTKNREC